MLLLAQQNSVKVSTGGAVALVVLLAVYLAFAVFFVVTYWKLFTKAGEPGWYAIIPILNIYTLIKIAGRPGWWVILAIIPFVNLVVIILVMLDLAKAFGKDTGFGIGLVFLGFIFLPILAFGDSQYLGPVNQTTYNPGYTPGYGAGQGIGQGAGFNQVASGYNPTAPAAATVPAAGWYPDPSGTGQRYWDGAQWSEHTAP